MLVMVLIEDKADQVIAKGNYSVPLFNKEGLGEILLDKSPSAPSLCSPPFSKGEVNTYVEPIGELS